MDLLSRPQLLARPPSCELIVARWSNIGVSPPSGLVWICEVNLLNSVWLNDDNSKVFPGGFMVQRSDLLA